MNSKIKIKLSINEGEADDFNLPADSDDSHAADPTKAGESFALVIHGTQPKKKKALTTVGA